MNGVMFSVTACGGAVATSGGAVATRGGALVTAVDDAAMLGLGGVRLVNVDRPREGPSAILDNELHGICQVLHKITIKLYLIRQTKNRKQEERIRELNQDG